MDHLGASQSQAVEKYLLDQLHGAERAEFEEHFFECGICAEDVRSGVLLLDNAAAEFQANPAASRARAKKRSWLDSFRIDWRQPAFAFPLLALVAVSGLWMRDHSLLTAELREPQVFNSVTVEPVRGGNAMASVVRGEKASAVSFFLDSESLKTYPQGYTLSIEGNGVAPAAMHFKQPPPNTAYSVLLPSARYRPGTYQFIIRGGSESNAPIVEQFALNLK